jgi:hypothetical protein
MWTHFERWWAMCLGLKLWTSTLADVAAARRDAGEVFIEHHGLSVRLTRIISVPSPLRVNECARKVGVLSTPSPFHGARLHETSSLVFGNCPCLVNFNS